eukprot:6435598-Pyramimonas_sp.AAC.1
MPSQISLALQPALPKPEDDGHRFIALLSMTVRSRSRRIGNAAAAWGRGRRISFSHVTEGKSFERAVWEQAFAAEHAT